MTHKEKKAFIKAMSLPEDIRTEIRDYVALVEKINKANKVTQKARAKKEDIGHSICEYMKHYKLTKKDIQVKNLRLSYVETQKKTALTQKFLKECLAEFLGDAKAAKQAVQFIWNPETRLYACLRLLLGEEERAKEAVKFILDKQVVEEKVFLKSVVQKDTMNVEAGPASREVQSALQTDASDEEF